MRKNLVVIGLVTAVGLLAQGPGPRPRGPEGRGPGFDGPRGFENPVAGQPYSGTRVTTSQQTLADGTLITQTEQSQIYRDSQGRVRTERTVTSPGSQTSTTRVTISDPVAGVMHTLDVANKVSYDSPMRRPPGNATGGGRTPRTAPTTTTNPNVRDESLGLQMIGSVSATGRRITRTIPAGTVGNSQPIQTVSERWFSEDLKVPVMEKTSDPRSGTRTTALNNVVRADPDPTLFQVPAGFTTKNGGPGPRPGPGRRGGRPGPQPPAQ